MTITREQIVELLASNVGCDCDISFGEVVGIEETAEAIQALIEVERDPLVDELVALFKWSDTSYLHALLHVKNAVLNERATASARIGELEKELQDEREKTGKYRNAMAKIPFNNSGYRDYSD